MIIEALFNLISVLIKTAFIFINISPFPEDLANSISSYMDLIFNNISWLGFFVRPTTLTIVASVAITIITFSRLYKVFMWIWRKLPISSN